MTDLGNNLPPGSESRHALKRVGFLADEQGATAIEYGLIAALVVVTAMVGLEVFATSVTGMFNGVADKVGAKMQ